MFLSAGRKQVEHQFLTTALSVTSSVRMNQPLHASLPLQSERTGKKWKKLISFKDPQGGAIQQF